MLAPEIKAPLRKHFGYTKFTVRKKSRKGATWDKFYLEWNDDGPLYKDVAKFVADKLTPIADVIIKKRHSVWARELRYAPDATEGWLIARGGQSPKVYPFEDEEDLSIRWMVSWTNGPELVDFTQCVDFDL